MWKLKNADAELVEHCIGLKWSATVTHVNCINTNNEKSLLHQHNILATPGMKIGTYLFTLNGADYLIVVDYTSNFPKIVKARD